MKRIAFSLATLVAVAAAPAMAQDISRPGAGQAGAGGLGGDLGGPGYSGMDVLKAPSDLGMTAVTGSRLNGVRREANRGRGVPFEVGMSPRQTRRYASDLLERADIGCDVAEAAIVGYAEDRIPVVEVDCAVGGGIVVIDSLPIQATDCLDLRPRVEGAENVLDSCRLPGNVATVAAARQAEGG
jgi:hypothetical protein